MTKFYWAISICILLPGFVFSQWVTHHDPLFMPNISRPDVGYTYSDPKTGIQVTRISDALNSGNAGTFPDYSKRQAWNADQSLMILRTDDGYTLLLDGQSYQFISFLDGVVGQDIFWHPSNPDFLYFSPDSILYSCHIPTGDIDPIHDFAPYTFANTNGEGNLSDDARYYAVVGQFYNYSTGEVTFNEILVYDILLEEVISSMTIPQDSIWGFDWVSISREGNFVVIDYADTETGRYHGVEVYGRMMNFLWQKPLGAGHSDLGTDANGDEILVMDLYDEETNETVYMKYRLSDGQETELLRTSLLFDQHISLRNEAREDWCFISTFDYVDRLTDDSLSWLPFEDEVFALKLDGSGDVQRIAHHHSKRYSPSTPDPDNSVYWSEPHATVDREGKRILWGSNWRQNMQNVNSVDAYVADFTGMLGFDNKPAQDHAIILFPNPATDILNLHLENSCGNFAQIKILDLSGREYVVFRHPMHNGIFDAKVPIEILAPGPYIVQVQTQEEIQNCLLIRK